MAIARLETRRGHTWISTLAVFGALVVVAGCKREAAPVEVEKEVTKAPSASPDSSAAAPRAPSPPPKSEPLELEFEGVAKLGERAKVEVSGAELIVCDPCSYPGQIAFKTIGRGGVKPLSVEPLGALLDQFYGKDFSRLKERFPGGPSLGLSPSKEAEIRVEVEASYDDDGISRNGYDSMSATFLYRAGKWGKLGSDGGSSSRSIWEDASIGDAAPRRYDDALAVSPLGSSRVISGGSGPLMVLGAEEFALFLGAEWKRFPLPSKAGGESALRLSDGSTLLDGPVVLRVAADGTTSVVNEDGIYSRFFLLGREPWLVRSVDGGTLEVMAPAEPVSTVTPDPREPFVPMTERGSGAVPAGEGAEGAGSGGGSAASEQPPFVAATNFTPACATPFVLLSTPPKAGWRYDATAKALRGAPFVGVRFYEVAAPGGPVSFGAQAADEPAARGLIERFQKAIPRSKPQLLCWDLASRVPDRYAPPPGFREVLLNPFTGTEYSFLR